MVALECCGMLLGVEGSITRHIWCIRFLQDRWAQLAAVEGLQATSNEELLSALDALLSLLGTLVAISKEQLTDLSGILCDVSAQTWKTRHSELPQPHISELPTLQADAEGIDRRSRTVSLK